MKNGSVEKQPPANTGSTAALRLRSRCSRTDRSEQIRQIGEQDIGDTLNNRVLGAGNLAELDGTMAVVAGNKDKIGIVAAFEK